VNPAASHAERHTGTQGISACNSRSFGRSFVGAKSHRSWWRFRF